MPEATAEVSEDSSTEHSGNRWINRPHYDSDGLMSSGHSTKRRPPACEALANLSLHDGSPVAYGALRIPGAKRESAKWAAVSSESKMEDIFKLVTEAWRLPPPPVIISVTGAAFGTFDQLKSLPKVIFRRGLREAARRTNAWIITGGTCAGIMQLVGQTVRESEDPLVCLGIATMGVINKHEDLLDSPPGTVVPYEVTEDDGASLRLPEKEQQARGNTDSRRVNLDPNHSHFLLVDNGTVGEFGGEVKFRANLESRICKSEEASKSEDDSLLPTPMVLVVVGGGMGTLHTIYQVRRNGGGWRAADGCLFSVGWWLMAGG